MGSGERHRTGAGALNDVDPHETRAVASTVAHGVRHVVRAELRGRDRKREVVKLRDDIESPHTRYTREAHGVRTAAHVLRRGDREQFVGIGQNGKSIGPQANRRTRLNRDGHRTKATGYAVRYFKVDPRNGARRTRINK